MSTTKEISNYYRKSATSNYERLFGNSRHFGYFPHIRDPSRPKLSFAEAGSALTRHMADIAEIDSHSRVIDFGCGAGQPLFEINQATGCRVEDTQYIMHSLSLSLDFRNTVNISHL